METNSKPFFAVKSWEDGILGALARCPRKGKRSREIFENKASSLVFFLLFGMPLGMTV